MFTDVNWMFADTWQNDCYKQIDHRMGFQPMFSATLEHMCDIHYSIMEEVADTLEEWKGTGLKLSIAKKVLVQLGYANNEIADGVRLMQHRKRELVIDCATAQFEELVADTVGIDIEFNSVEWEVEA